MLGSRAQGLQLFEPWWLDDTQTRFFLDHLPEYKNHPAGGHLMEAWQWGQERHLFPAWLEPVAGSRRIGEAQSPEVCRENCVALIGLGSRLRELFEGLLIDADLPARLRRLKCPVTLASIAPMMRMVG